MHPTSAIALILFAACTAAAAAAMPAGAAAGVAEDPSQLRDIEIAVSLDANEQGGSATASVKIHARREVVWSLITSCAETLRFIPGLVACDVMDTAPDRSSQRIRHVMNYSWYLPKLTYEFRATYAPPSGVSIERVSGDLRVLRGSWALQTEGDDTIAHYAMELASGIWVPHWIMRAALQRDLPKMLRALRSRAEFVQGQRPG